MPLAGSAPSASLSALLQRADIRRAADLAQVALPSVGTGFDSLDAELPGGGWPAGALSEILPAHPGIGELRLLGPALAQLSRRGRRLAWIAPPYLPYAPALSAAGIDLATLIIVKTRTPTDALWAAEQALSSAACGAVLLWPQHWHYKQMRRLQIAAEGRDTLAFVFGFPGAATASSPAALRIALSAATGGIRLDILKRRGGALHQPLFISPSPPHAVDRPLSPPIRPFRIALPA
jgi:hypothetical protein